MRKSAKIVLILAAVCAVLLFSSCGEPAGASPTPAEASAAAHPESEPGAEQPADSANETFPFPYAFEAEDLYGNTVTEAALGEKELFFVHLWATWCGPCINEMPDLAQIAKDYGDRVGFIALLDDFGAERTTAIRIKENSGAEFLTVDAHNTDMKPLYDLVNSGYLPTTVLIDKNGAVIGDPIIGAAGMKYADYINDALMDM